MKNLYFLVSLFLFFILQNNICAQSLSVFNVNASEYPKIKGMFYAQNASNKQITDVNISDFKIVEDGVTRSATYVSCPTPKPITPVSLAISIDISGSMSYLEGSSQKPVELGKTTARNLVNAFALPPSEIAIQTCDAVAYINQDFTSDKNKLLNAINPIAAYGDNNFVEHLLNPKTGILNVAKHGANKRVALLFTDAWWYPLTSDELQQCKDTCAKYNIKFYAVILSRKEAMPDGIKASLKELADVTGGRLIDNIITEEMAENLAYELQNEIQNMDPCSIEWISDGCNIYRTAEITLLPYSISANTTYKVSESVLPALDLSNNSVSFGSVAAGAKVQKTVTITAKNKPVKIQSVQPDMVSFKVIDYGGSAPPFTLQPGENRILTIEFTAPDSGFYYSRIEIVSDACLGNIIYASAGRFSPGKTNPTLKLTFPNGKETLLAGSDTVITWEGILPSEKVSLEYSTDSGANWIFITDTASGLKYNWKVPNTPGFKCLMRVKELGEKSSLSKFTELYHDCHWINSLAWSPDGVLLATSGCNNIFIWDAKTGNKMYSWDIGAWNAHSLSWTGNGNRLAAICDDTTIKIWDAGTGTLLKFFTWQYYRNCAYTEKSYLRWSPDGNYLAIIEYGRILIVDPSTGGIIRTIGNGYLSNVSVNWCSDNKRILAESGTGSIIYNTIWDAGTGNELLRVANDSDNVCVEGMDWSPDGKFFATNYFQEVKYSKPPNYELRIYDSYNGNLVKSLPIESYTRNVAWNPLGNQIAVDRRNGRYVAYGILVWDIMTDSITDLRFSEDKIILYADNWEIRWSPDGCKLAACGYTDAGLACIWSFCDNVLQEDVSDTLWAIVAPQADANNVDMGKVLVNHSRDSLVRNFIFNSGTYPVRIDTIFFTGTDAAMFSVVSGFPPFEVIPSGKKAVEFRFKPASVGIKTAVINIVTGSGDTLKRYIRGEGIENILEVSSDLLDFGQVWLTKYKDTVKVMIKNVSSDSVRIISTDIIGPDMTQFFIISGGGAFTLQPGTERQLKLRFRPVQTGRTSSRLAFSYKGTGSPAVANMYGEGIEMKTLVYFPDTTAFLGQVNFKLPLYIRINNESVDSTMTLDSLSFTGEVRLPADAFKPYIPSILTGDVNDPVYAVNISGDNISIGKNARVLMEIPGTVFLSSSVKSPIIISKFEWSNKAIKADTAMGYLTVSGCRLQLKHLEMANTMSLSIQPNPAKDLINIILYNPGGEAIKISLYSAQSIKVDEITVDKSGIDEEIKINTDKLTQGIYYIMAQSGSRVVYERVVVVK